MTNATRPAIRAQAERHRLLGDETRLMIVDALAEGPRTVAELARLAGVHANTVRSHLARLEGAGVVDPPTSQPSRRGRPALRYRLREPLPMTAPEFRMLVGSLLGLVERAYSADANDAAEAEGHSVGLTLASRLQYATAEQVVDQVLRVLRHLSFSPELVSEADGYRFVLRSCPFGVGRGDRRGRIVCAFHLGLIRGVAEGVGSAGVKRVDLHPHVDAATCEAVIELDRPPASTGRSNRRRARLGGRSLPTPVG
jgi:predicted ArsR family transcriptional regulator